MSKLPKFPSNKAAWRTLNQEIFGPECRCPVCDGRMRECYISKYLWCRKCRKKYRATAHKGTWLYGMKISPRQFCILAWCFKRKKSPDTAQLLAQVSGTSVQRWYQRFKRHVATSGIIHRAATISEQKEIEKP